MACFPEQSCGLLVLLVASLLIGRVGWDQVRNYEWPAYSGPACEMRGEYLGRDDEGRPEWEYWEKCYE